MQEPRIRRKATGKGTQEFERGISDRAAFLFFRPLQFLRSRGVQFPARSQIDETDSLCLQRF
jgi:hypothetical protein